MAYGVSAQVVTPSTKPVFDKAASRFIRLFELPHRRAEAVAGLFDRGAAGCHDLTRAMASDPRPEIVQFAAHVLRDLGATAKAAAPMLEILAKSEDPMRALAAKWALSGVRPQGILLISSTTPGSLKELDANGKQTFEIQGLKSCFDAERLPNGNYLVACYTEKLIKEIDRKGKVIWKHQSKKRPMDIDRLPSGNTLIATIDGETLEIDPAGKTVWSFKTKSSYEADRLPNGNTLISEYGSHRVIEVTPAGKIVWTYKGQSPMDADRMPNGNTWIVLYGTGAHLVDKKGKRLRQIRAKSSYDLKVLPDDAVLLTGNDGLRKYDKAGKLLWTRKFGTVGSIEVY